LHVTINRATDEQIEQIGTFDSSLQDALDGCRQDAQLRGFAVPWCDRCTATIDKGCNQQVVIDLADSADEGSDTCKKDIEDGSAINEGSDTSKKDIEDGSAINEGSDNSKKDIEDGSAIIEGSDTSKQDIVDGSQSEVKMDVASDEGADPPGNVEDI
jgi:hypothetical protein